MCCLFGNNCNCGNQCVRVIRGPMGPAGPQGARGPIGPQGATGATGATGVSGTADIIYANSNTETVATNTIIPLDLNTATTGTTMSVSSNSVNLPASGTYLVSYFVNGSVPSDNLQVALYLNGSPITGETITLTNTANSFSAGSKTILVTTTGAGTLSLYNTSSQTATIADASITVLRSV